MLHSDFTHNLRSFNLRLQHVLLHSLPNCVVGRGILNELTENGLVLPQDFQCLLQVGELQIIRLYGISNTGLCYLKLGLLSVGLSFGDLSPEAQFARIRQFLGGADANIGKITVGVPGERSRTPQR